MTRLRALTLVLALLAACADESTQATQVLVSVFAEPTVASQLDRLDARIYPVDAVVAAPAAQTHSFALARTSPRDGQVKLPLSFGVARGASDHFLLVLTGYGSTQPDAPPLVEHKVLGSFMSGRSVVLSVTLTQTCLGADKLCAGLDRTCYAVAAGPIAAGQCGPVGTAVPDVTVDIDAGQVVTARLDAATAPETGARESSVDDAGAPDAQLLDTSVAAPAEPLPDPTCSFETTCAPDYPCLPSTSSGFTCRGQLAEWPMPGRAPGSKFAPSYEVAAPGVVRDRVTGLLWQQELPKVYAGCSGEAGAACTWREARAYCAQLRHGNLRWRLPGKIELESLVDETRWVPASKEPASIDVTFFPGTPQDHFWTNSQVQFVADEQAYAVSFAGGHTQAYKVAKPYAVRCVHSEYRLAGTPDDRYRVDAAADTVTDLRTQLTWQRSPNEASVDHAGAESYCQGLSGGFRLPTMKELSTIYNPDQVRTPSVPAVFYPNAPKDEELMAAYWTTSRWLLEANGYYVVELDFGSHISGDGLREVAAMVELPYVTRAWCVK